MDLKFRGSISNVNIDNPYKFREVSMLRTWISKSSGFWCVIYIPDHLCQKRFLIMCLLQIAKSGKNFIVLLIVVPKILGGYFHPQSCHLSCLKSQKPLTVEDTVCDPRPVKIILMLWNYTL